MSDPPERCRFIVKDATVEALTEILSTNPNGVLVYRDELMGLLSSLDKDGREDSRAFYLESWNGNGSFVSDRIGRGHIHIPKVCVSILGGIQPGKLEPYVRQTIKGGSGDDGLLQRFQVLVWPDQPREWRNVDRWPDTDAKKNAHEVFERLIQLSPEEDSRRFSPEAQELFNDWRLALENKIRSDDLHPALESHLSKYRKLMPALALLLHIADNEAGEVPLKYAELAAGWCEYLESHAKRIYGSTTNAANKTAHLIAKRFPKLENGFCCRDVYRKQWSGLTDRGLVQEGIDYLIDDGWLSAAEEATGGKSKITYYINPKVSEVQA